MRGRLLLLLMLLPMAELFLLISVHRAVADRYGGRAALGVTLGAIIGTGILGALLARLQGTAAVQQLRATLARGEDPGGQVLDAVLIVAGGALLILPGYLTDLLGLTLLVPISRRWYRRALGSWLHRKIERGEVLFWGQSASPQGPIRDEARPGEIIIDTELGPAEPRPDRPDSSLPDGLP